MDQNDRQRYQQLLIGVQAIGGFRVSKFGVLGFSVPRPGQVARALPRVTLSSRMKVKHQNVYYNLYNAWGLSSLCHEASRVERTMSSSRCVTAR